MVLFFSIFFKMVYVFFDISQNGAVFFDILNFGTVFFDILNFVTLSFDICIFVTLSFDISNFVTVSFDKRLSDSIIADSILQHQNIIYPIQHPLCINAP